MDDQFTYLNGDGRIRLIIFLISGLCGGLPALVWAGRILHQYRRLQSRNSILIITLLFNDAVELFLIPFIITGIATHCAWLSCLVIFDLFSGVRFLGLHLHQLVALEGILSLTHPRLCHLLSSVPCYTALTLAMVTGIALTFIFPLLTLQAMLFVVPSVTAITMCVLMPNDRPDWMVLTVSLVTLLGFYGPFFFTLLMLWNHEPSCYMYPNCLFIVWETMSVSIMSLRVMADPLLCILVCRLPRMQLSQTAEASD